MWLEHEGHSAGQQWHSAHPVSPIQASYRRGILRAKVNVQDLSCSAASIDCMDNPRGGTLIWLTLPGLEARAAIVESCEGFRAFLRFTQPFHPAVLDAFLNGAIRRYH